MMCAAASLAMSLAGLAESVLPPASCMHPPARAQVSPQAPPGPAIPVAGAPPAPLSHEIQTAGAPPDREKARHSPDRPRARSGDAAIREEFDGARRAGTREAYDLFIARHPDHPLAGTAQAERERLP